jgi:hypothetical protein
MNWTPATSISLPGALFVVSPATKTTFSAPFWCNASPFDATLPGALVCVAFKGLREIVSLLDATLAKNRGVGGVMVNQTSNWESLLPGPNILRGSAAALEVFRSAEWTHPIRIPHELSLTLHKRRRRQSPSCRAQVTEYAPPNTFHRPRIAVILSSADS